jgi:hypothetical protein
LALSGVGCGKSKSNGSDGASGSSNSNGSGLKTLDQFVAQVCAELANCCETAGRPSDGAQCRAFFSAFVPSASSYDESAAGACLDEVRAGGDQNCESGALNTPSCIKVFQRGGTKQPGVACKNASDCASSDSGRVDCASRTTGDASVQQCQLQLPGKVGSSPCLGTVDGSLTFFVGDSDALAPMGYLCDIADGVTCDEQTHACEALGAPGEPCANGLRRCVSSAYCSFADEMCKDRVALGAECESDDACQVGTYCDPRNDTCAPQSALGEDCANNAECLSESCINQTCGSSNDLGLTFLCGN